MVKKIIFLDPRLLVARFKCAGELNGQESGGYCICLLKILQMLHEVG